MFCMNKLFAFLLFLLVHSIYGQIGMNDWRIHFSAYNAIGVAAVGTDVYMACSNGIVNYDTEDNSINFLTVTNGLSDLGISTIADNGSIVMVGYNNGNLDIIDGTNVINIPWIKLADLQGSKNVNAIYFSDNTAYISSSVGLVVFDLAKMEVRDTYYPYSNPVIFDATIYQDTLYLGTENGIYYAHKDAPFLNDKAQWSHKSLPISIINESITEVETFGDYLFFAYDAEAFNADSLYYIQSGSINPYSGNPVNIENILNSEGKLLLTMSSSIQLLDASLNELDLIYQYPGLDPPKPKATISTSGYLWIADGNNGLVRASTNWNGVSLYSESPFTDGCYRMDLQYGKLLVAGGGLTHNLINNYFRNGVYVFEDEKWTNFNYKTHTEIDYDTDWDFISVAINPNNTDEFAFSGFSHGGIKVVKDGSTISDVWNDTNSPLEVTSGSMVISDMVYDDQGNLWVVNSGVEPLKCFTPDGAQYSYSLGSAAKNKFVYRLMIDNNGVKWAGVTNVGLVAFDDGGTLDDTSDDQLKTLTASEGYGNLPSIFVKAIAQDIDGEIWIGTEQGFVVLYSTAHVFDGGYGEYDANPILLEVDNEVEKLLGDTYITAIAIDGGNRKWIGTSSSGVFCLSPDGLEEIYRFTSDNSPLISDNVLDIRVDHASGEVYFATDKGLVSFRADATIADNDFSNVTVFPNPVRPDFSGPVTIQGLGYQSDVKITDVAGNLVYKTTSNGGTVIWNGKTLQGERVQSGVYLVWSAVTTGKGKKVAKILFIN